MKLQCKKCGRIVNAPISALTDGSDCSECGGSFKIANSNNNSIRKYIFIGIALLVFIILVFGLAYTISAGERGIILTFGKPSELASSEGLHFKMPLVQSVVKMDIKTQKYEADLSAASKDLQTVTTKIAINYKISEDSVVELYRTVGMDYANKIIYPIEQEVNKGTTAQFTAEELITKREQVRENMLQSLRDKLSSRGIIVEEVSIVNFDFSKSFNDAIEAKVTAEQNALAAKNKLEQVKYESEQAVTAAKGQADAQALLAISVNKDTLQYQALLNQKSAIEKWNGVLPQVTGGAMPFINLNSNSSI